ncbi:MAG: hypothetical protein EXR69_06375 [Myxococcales bacterium]|nr:hypothetical protein [Myxococcales bacterium]
MSAEVKALLALLVIMVLGWVGYQVLFDTGSAARIVLRDVQGDVRVETGGREAAATVGGQIGASDRLVSGQDGRAVLAFGADSRVTLEPNTSVQITSVDATGVKLSLENGRVLATVRPGGPVLGLSAAGQTITASDAEFTVVRSLDAVGVESTRGSVTVDGAEVAAGSRTLFPVDGTPLQMPVSNTLLLQMVWPAQKRTAASQVRVTGTTEPGARVQARTGAGTALATAGSDGVFAFDIGIAEGENTVAVEVINVFGQVSAADWQVSRDSSPPAIGVQIDVPR